VSTHAEITDPVLLKNRVSGSAAAGGTVFSTQGRRLAFWTIASVWAFLLAAQGESREDSRVISGVIAPLWGDSALGFDEPSPLLFMLTDDLGKITILDISSEIVTLVGGLAELGRRRVEVSVSDLEAGATRVREVTAISLAPEYSPAAALSGAQTWISVLCKFSDVADELENMNYFLGMYANAMRGLDHYWRELSYDQVNLGGSTAVG